MKTIKNIIAATCLCLLAMGCDKKSETVTNAADYNKYLINDKNKSLAFTKGEIIFWQNKYDKAPNQLSYLSVLASNYSKLFEITANIDDLLKAEELLVKSNETYKYSNVGTIRSLARNYISQHKFREALTLAQKAETIGEGIKETHKLLFDVQMELGNYAEAEKNLKLLNDQQDFDYLIRAAKWNDHLGDLKTTIALMEKAKVKAEKFNNNYLKIWTYSNLGDFNGHAGNIQKSYEYYLKTLAVDPNNCYALKGIAWIVFSHEKNTKEANRIIDIVDKKHNSPDFYLLKSQIAEYENNTEMRSENLETYFKMLDSNKYGAMYNRYNALIFAENKYTVHKALEIAKVEINHRPTPDSYDLLAWSYYNMGNKQKALEIAQQHIAGKSFEPKLNYHLAVIYKANNQMDKVAPIKEELLKSTFELGPNLERKIISL
jgi:phosphopantetheine adenylyltransferase